MPVDLLAFSFGSQVVGGHLVSATIGITSYSIFGDSMMWLAVPVATASAIMAMQATKTVHPPAGGTVLIALMGSAKVHAMGYALLAPIGLTSTILVGCGLALNNFKEGSPSYPTYW
jgi:CBS-domain-containing membrane protein